MVIILLGWFNTLPSIAFDLNGTALLRALTDRDTPMTSASRITAILAVADPGLGLAACLMQPGVRPEGAPDQMQQMENRLSAPATQ